MSKFGTEGRIRPHVIDSAYHERGTERPAHLLEIRASLGNQPTKPPGCGSQGVEIILGQELSGEQAFARGQSLLRQRGCALTQGLIPQARHKRPQILGKDFGRAIGGDLHVEARHFQRTHCRLARLDSVEQRFDFRRHRPQREDAAARGGHGVVGSTHAGLGKCYVIQAGFPDQHIEAVALVQELHDPRFGGKTGAGAMAGLAQLHHTRRTDCVGQRLQIAEIFIGGVYRAYR